MAGLRPSLYTIHPKKRLKNGILILQVFCVKFLLKLSLWCPFWVFKFS